MIDLRPGQRRALAILMAHGTLRASVLGRMAGYCHKDVADRVRALRGRGLVELAGGSKGHTAICTLTARGRRVASRLGTAGVAGLVLAACCGRAEAHGWYGALRSPTGVPCCSDTDCRKLDACTLPDGKQGVAANGGCWPVPYDKVLPGLSSPDGEMHGCFPNTAGQPVWLCFVMPGAA